MVLTAPVGAVIFHIICAREGSTARAWLLWSELVRDVPDYGPARTNLALLGRQNEVVLGETASIVLPPAAAVKTIEANQLEGE